MTFRASRRSKDLPVAPYVYFIQSAMPPGWIRIGAAQRPLSILQQLQAQGAGPLKLVGAVRAFSVFEEILRRQFRDQLQFNSWILPSPRLLTLVATIKKRKPEALLLADDMASLMREVFPETPHLWCLSQYRASQAYAQNSRRKKTKAASLADA